MTKNRSGRRNAVFAMAVAAAVWSMSSFAQSTSEAGSATPEKAVEGLGENYADAWLASGRPVRGLLTTGKGAKLPEKSLLMIQGPLTLNWHERKWGLLPRIENGDLHARNPPTWDRFEQWLSTGVRVTGQPNWVFVKLHTHRDHGGLHLADEIGKAVGALLCLRHGHRCEGIAGEASVSKRS